MLATVYMSYCKFCSNKHKIYFQNIDNERKARERETEESLRAADTENKALQKKLDQQVCLKQKLFDLQVSVLGLGVVVPWYS